MVNIHVKNECSFLWERIKNYLKILLLSVKSKKLSKRIKNYIKILLLSVK